ncbi:MAG: hypothetical protein ABSE49_26465 [Polyangiaceae bacterium]|jgi:hypothetical protein
MGDSELLHLYDRARGELRRWMPFAPYVESWITYERTLLESTSARLFWWNEDGEDASSCLVEG